MRPSSWPRARDPGPRASVARPAFGHHLAQLSLGVAPVPTAAYLAGLFFSLRPHRDLFNPEHDEAGARGWTVRRSVLTLVGAAVLVAVASNSLVGSVEQASHAVGLSQFFIGVFVVAIVGNASEHYVAVVAAAKDKMDLAVNIAIGSSAQIGLFVAPVVVLLPVVIGPRPLALVFHGSELAAPVLAVWPP